MKRKALGRGISALIPGTPERGGQAALDYFLCPIEKIRVSKQQPRQRFDDERLAELAASIREQGLVQPLLVRPASGDTFTLVAGERRWRAAQKAGLHEVPVVIRELTDRQAFEIALVENLQREDLDPLEEAQGYQRLIEEHGYKQEQLAERLGRDRSTIANSLRLLRLPQAAQQALVRGELSSGHARALLALEKAAAINAALKQVKEKGLSVRQTETLVRRLKEPEPPPTRPHNKPSINAKDLEHRLTRALQTRVHLVSNANGAGRIEIAFGSLDELDRLLEVLLG